MPQQDKPQAAVPNGAGRGAQQPPQKQQPQAGRRFGVQAPGIIFDSDMGRNIDAALALGILYTLGAKGRIIAAGVSNASLESAAFCDAVARFYSIDPARSTGNVPIYPTGLAEDGVKLPTAPMLSVPLSMKKDDGSAAFATGLKDIRDTADVRVLYRNSLQTQRDGEGTVVLAGPATNLAKTLALNGGRETITAKVGLLVAGLGAYPDGPPDPRVKADIASAKQMFAKWPSPIVAVGTEAGAALPYPATSIEKDFAWAPANPIVAAYRAFQQMPYDAPSQAVLAAFFAGNQKEGYFKLSDPGTIEVLDDGRTRFTPSATGKHRYLIVDPAQKERALKAITETASAKPVPRVFRFQ